LGYRTVSFLVAVACFLAWPFAGCDSPVALVGEAQTELATRITLKLGEDTALTLIHVRPGTFRMGSVDNEPGRKDDELRHVVTITKPFYLAATETTQAQWRAVMQDNPSLLWGADRPVEHVCWNRVVVFCEKLSEASGLAVRLPTEAEWEYACRAGSEAQFCGGDDAEDLDEYAWFQGNSGPSKTRPVTGKRANAWGFYDMHGNVREWCMDWYAPYSSEATIDPAGPEQGTKKVIRGGSWGYVASLCRSASRQARSPDHRNGYVGFRIAAGLGDLMYAIKPDKTTDPSNERSTR